MPGLDPELFQQLADGSKVLAVFNRDGGKSAEIEVGWDEFGECCEQRLYDVWRQKDIGTYDGGISVKLSPNGVAVFKLDSH